MARCSASRALFGQGELSDLDAGTLAAAIAEVPHVSVPAAGGLPPVADLLTATGLEASKSAARRAIAEGGAYLNNVKVASEDAVPGADDLLHGRFLVLRRGKRTVGAVEVKVGVEVARRLAGWGAGRVGWRLAGSWLARWLPSARW